MRLRVVYRHAKRPRIGAFYGIRRRAKSVVSSGYRAPPASSAPSGVGERLSYNAARRDAGLVQLKSDHTLN
jgi:hypothetical protein